MASTDKISEVENLSRIRDILFGEDLQSIEQKIGVAKDENSFAFKNLKKELNNSIKEIGILQKDKFKELDGNLKSYNETQKSIIVEIKRDIIKIENTFNEKIKNISDKISNAESSFNEIIKQIKEEHNNYVNMLSDSKIDKKVLAEILIEAASKLNK